CQSSNAAGGAPALQFFPDTSPPVFRRTAHPRRSNARAVGGSSDRRRDFCNQDREVDGEARLSRVHPKHRPDIARFPGNGGVNCDQVESDPCAQGIPSSTSNAEPLTRSVVKQNGNSATSSPQQDHL